MNKKLLLFLISLFFGFKIECASSRPQVVIVGIDSDMLSKLKKQPERRAFFQGLHDRHPNHSLLLGSYFPANTPEYVEFCRLVSSIDLEGDIRFCRSTFEQHIGIGHFQAIIRLNGVVNVGFSIPVTVQEYRTFLGIVAHKINLSFSAHSAHQGPPLITRAVSTPSSFKPVFKK